MNTSIDSIKSIHCKAIELFLESKAKQRRDAKNATIAPALHNSKSDPFSAVTKLIEMCKKAELTYKFIMALDQTFVAKQEHENQRRNARGERLCRINPHDDSSEAIKYRKKYEELAQTILKLGGAL
jgi:predicted TIM-barrel fold metal-dependent hydrolase